MTSELAHVLADIKSWERDFSSTHGRDPNLQDIRGKPDIAEKYKRYKKLSKTATRLPAPKARPADSLPSLPGFNPFSPTKKSVKRDRTSTSRPPTVPSPNHFATPVKNTCFPAETLPLQLDTSSSHVHPIPTSAVSRARKRLRGEPVSPSPKKQKRQRVPSQILPRVPNLDQDSSDSEHETDQELPHCNFTPSFVADSPAKAPAGGKSFKRLFDDVLPNGAKLDGSSINRLDSDERSIHPVLKPRHDMKSKGTISRPEPKANHLQGKLPAQIFPAKGSPTASLHKQQASQPGTSTKRAMDSDLSPSQPQHLLIPPSPPPQDSINRDSKGKAKATSSRKKMRVENKDSDDSSDDIALKVATVTLHRSSKHQHTNDDPEWDPLLHLRARNHDSAATARIDADRHALGTFTVDLPNKLRRVLAISPEQSQNSSEERVVRGLMYGDRVGHYDPSRGGAIWDAGETDEGVLGDAEAEDDWEGEPVSWEVAEL